MDEILLVQSNGLDHRSCIVREKACEAHAVRLGLLEQPRNALGAITQANHHYVMSSPELATNQPDKTTGSPSKQAKKKPAIKGKEQEKTTAEVEPKQELHQDRGHMCRART